MITVLTIKDPAVWLVLLISHLATFVLAIMITASYLGDTNKGAGQSGSSQSDPGLSKRQEITSYEDLEVALSERDLLLRWKQEEITVANEKIKELEDKLQSFRDLQEARQEVQVRPDFNPTLGGVPFPGSPGSQASPGSQESLESPGYGEIPTPEIVEVPVGSEQ